MTKVSFFKPAPSDAPFAELDGAVSFSVGAEFSVRSVTPQPAIATLLLTIVERDGRNLVSPRQASMTRLAKEMTAAATLKVLDAFRRADPTIRVEESTRTR